MTSTCGAIYALATAEPHTASVVSCDRAPNHAGEHCGCSPHTGMLVSWSDKDMPRCLARDVARRKLHPALAPVDCQKPAGHSGLHVGTLDGGVWTWGGEPTRAPAEDRIFEVLKKHEERFFNVTQLSRLDMEARRDLEERTRRHCSAIGEAQTLLRTNVHGISTKVDEMRSRIAVLERAVRRRWWQRS